MSQRFWYTVSTVVAHWYLVFLAVHLTLANSVAEELSSTSVKSGQNPPKPSKLGFIAAAPLPQKTPTPNSSSQATNPPSQDPKRRDLPVRQMRRLYDHLFSDYQHDLRPVMNESQPLSVGIQFWLKQILKVDERDQTLNVYLWLELYWVDEFLKWSPADYGGLDRIHVPSSKIWRPDILVYNNANMNVEESEMETNAIVKHNGEVTLFRAMITDIACTLSLSMFPFDQQICYLTFASWSMDGSKLMLFPVNGTDNLELYIRNTEWELIDFAVRMYEKVYDCCPYPFPDVTYFVALKRTPAYYIFRSLLMAAMYVIYFSLIVPSAFITVVTIVGFFTPHSTTGENTEKVSTAVTALLSMTIIMMMVSDEVPATSDVMPLIGKYYIGLIFLIFIAAFTTTLTLAFQMRGNAGLRMSRGMRHFLFDRLARFPFLGSWVFTVQIWHRRSIRAKTRKAIAQQQQHLAYCESNGRRAKPCGGSGGGCSAIAESITSLVSDGTNAVNNKVIVNHCSPPGGLSRPREKRARIVRMEELIGQRIACSSMSSDEVEINGITEPKAGFDQQNPANNNPTTVNVQFAIGRLYDCIHAIERSVQKAEEQRLIEFEWEQGTRIIERLIMILYIIATALFAFIMLGNTGEDLRLTTEAMDRLKR